MPGPRAEATSRQEPRSFRVWYGTNREPIDRQDLSVGFGGRRERDPGTVHYGICEITIPASHRFGSTGSTWWRRWLRRKDDRLKLGDICGLAAATFWGLLAKELSGRARSDRRALVYVHGFNVTFRDAAIRAAQIGCDLSEPGITAFFSWPSKGKPHEYPADEASIEASEEAIADFLVGFATRTRARQVNVVAYSMGNRGLLRALQRIRGRAERQSAVRFNQIFLAAPDVDADLFRQLAVVYREFAKRTTLYASASDLAVGLSGWIHSAPRAGFTPPVTVVPGIDTVVVPDFDVDRLGHGYYAAAEAVLHDMFDLLQRNAAPARRQRLAAQRIDESVRYWTMVR
ncbi:MAG: alpha/beta hydrolase [Candidatus Binatia bacterium]